MKLKKCSIRGFRSLKDLSWEPGDLNILIGPNGSGKSNLLRALELLQQAGLGNLENAIIREGGLRALLWDSQVPGISWRITVDPTSVAFQDAGELAYELCLLGLGLHANYTIDYEALDFTKTLPQNGARTFTYFTRDQKEVTFFTTEGGKTKISSRLIEGQPVLSQTSGLFSGLFESSDSFFFKEYLKTWKFYQNLAVHPESAARRSAITRKEIQLSPTGENLIATLHTLYSGERHFKTRLNEAMLAAFGKEFEELEFPPAEDHRTQMRVRWKSLKNSHSTDDLSEGTLKFLMLVAILANPNRGILVAIDEPETYLHPSMFPVIAELASEASKSSQIIFTTHSPEFLTSLGDHNPTTAVLQNFNGQTKLNVLDQQEMSRWLEKYKLGELFVSGDLEALV